MFELFFVLVVYSVLILLFVPLETIGKYQTKIKTWFSKLGK